MKKILKVFLAICALLVIIGGCNSLMGEEDASTSQDSQVSQEQVSTADKDTQEDKLSTPAIDSTETEKAVDETQEPEKAPEKSAKTDNTAVESSPENNESEKAVQAFSISSVPAYSGKPYVEVNENKPYFTDTELTTSSFENYSSLDSLGRCGVAYANIGVDLMPTEERGSIGQIKPTGWHTVKYNGVVDGNYLYNRCHLIGYQLTAENANKLNLITGTRYLNVEGMLPFENMVADYIHETENHVLYRVTPIFEGNNLVASGVLMEAKSVEDDGEGILFNVYCYNVQPNITIDYATGDSSLNDNATTSTASKSPAASTQQNSSTGTSGTTSTSQGSNTSTGTSTGSSSQSTGTTPQQEPSTEEVECTYILNTNTKKFHNPSCSSVNQMNDNNKVEYTGSRDELISQGYSPCKRCNP